MWPPNTTAPTGTAPTVTMTVPATAPAADVKPGWKTTEFWLTSAASLIGLLYGSGAIGSGSTLATILGFATAALTSLGYTVSRGQVKASSVSSSS